MPVTEVFFFQDDDGSVPVLDWMNGFRRQNARAYRKCLGLIQLLEQFGHELRSPQAGMLRDGVYELRTRVGNVNYRIRYGFVGKDIALLTAGFTKERKVPSKAIEQAIDRIARYRTNPESYGFGLDEEEK